MEQLLAVAIDKDKSSQAALRWAVDNLAERGETIFLLHVKTKAHQNMSEEMERREIFLPFRCYATRKEVHCKDIHLEGSHVAKAIVEFVSLNGIDKLVIGASRKNAFLRFKGGDVPSSVTKGAPDFCTVYVISKEKPSSIKKASREAPTVSPLRTEIQDELQKRLQVNTKRSLENQRLSSRLSNGRSPSYCSPSHRSFEERNDTRSPFSRGLQHHHHQQQHQHQHQQQHSNGRFPLDDTDISFVSSGRPSSERLFPSFFDENEQAHKPPRLSNLSGHRNSDMIRTPRKSSDTQLLGSEYSGFSPESNLSSSSSQTVEEVEAEMRRLKLELKQTITMYNTACKEALDARKKENELIHWKMEEEKRLKEAMLVEEMALAIVRERE